MQRIYDSTAASSLPSAPSLTGTVGYFTEGVPGSVAATDVRGWWLNMLQEELMSLLTAAGITPDTTATNFTQVLVAVRALGSFQNTAVYAIAAGSQQVSINGAAFTTTGASNFIIPASGRYSAEGWGAGGGSGGTASGSATGGGAAGTYGQNLYTGTPGASLAVTIGLGGTAGGTGGNGGATSLGTVLTCPGGGGSPSNSTVGTGGNGGASGGAATGAAVTIAGQSGSGGGLVGSQVVAGFGGSAPFMGGTSYLTGTPTTPASGAGGVVGVGASAGGVAGATGYLIVRY